MGELRETINELFNLQGNKLFRTIKGLTVAPGNTIRTFAEGDRTTFLHPFTYALTFIGLLVFFLSMVNSELEFTEEKRLERQEAIENLSQKESLTDKEKVVLKFYQLYENYGLETPGFEKFMQYFSFFLFSISHLFVFKNLGYGLKKNAWFIFYTYAHITLFTIITFPLFFFTAGNATITLILYIIAIILTGSYQAWSALQYYEITIGRAIKKYVFIVLIFFPLILIVGITYTILLFLFTVYFNS